MTDKAIRISSDGVIQSQELEVVTPKSTGFLDRIQNAVQATTVVEEEREPTSQQQNQDNFVNRRLNRWK